MTSRLHLVISGHVDHGKSTLVGRLLADTGSLPEGKLEQVRALCERTSKPFEYAFLLDALKDERAQGITIDAARVFFKTATRDYIIIDAPGHIEFLKNLITGAARAEQALNEGSLTAKIKAKMALDDTVRALSIDVDTNGSTVTLSGSVNSEAERAKAVQLARETEGVTQVNDRLVVR